VAVPEGALSSQSFSPDAPTVTALTAAAVDGWRSAGVLPAVGHFPGQGSASADPDQGVGSVGLSLGDLRSRDETPFAGVARTAPAIVMSNALFAAWDGVTPAGLSSQAVGELRGHLGYQGVVLSDDLGATTEATGADMGASAVAALKAGVDLLRVSGDPTEQADAYQAILAAVRRGAIAPARIREALRRVLALKVAAGVLPRR
jgi:beta-N-acetylhexosaminidase